MSIRSLLLNQAGKNAHEHICESLELFAKEVMPEFVGREPEHQAWKQSVLDGTTVLDDIDTTLHTRNGPVSVKAWRSPLAQVGAEAAE